MTPSEIRERIENAKVKANRINDKIIFTAVSKNHSVDEMKPFEKFVDAFGENRVQEAMNTKNIYGACKIQWRLIGHLQHNKINKALEIFDTIDSVDSVKLAEKLNEHSAALNRITPVLIEVNTSGEEAKTGIDPKNLNELLDCMAGLKNLRLDGMMTVGPLTDDEIKIRNSFAQLRTLNENARERTGLELPILSMGMSGDFELAILEGSTMVRIGTLLFGARDYSKQFIHD